MMQSTWYYLPGQTPGNTKISERSRALIASKTAWGKILHHLDKDRLLKEIADEELRHKEEIRAGSQKMTVNWENSVQNIRKRRLEAHKGKGEAEKEERIQQFFQMRKEQEEERLQHVEEAFKTQFMLTSSAETANKALIMSEVLYEREKQIELAKTLGQREKDDEAKYHQKILQDAEEERLEKIEEEVKRRQAMQETKQIYLKQIRQNAERDRALVINQKETERADLIKMEKEYEKIKKEEGKHKWKKIEEVRKTFKEHMAKKKEMEDRDKEEERQLEIIRKLVQDSKDRITCLTKKRQKELIDEVVKRREEITAKIKIEHVNRMASEEAWIEKAKRQQEEKEDQRNLEELQKLERQKNEAKKLYKEWLEQEEKRKLREREHMKYEMLQRYKSTECWKAYDEAKAIAQQQRVLETRKIFEDHMKVRQEELEAEKEEQKKSWLLSMEEKDRQFLEYANEVLEFAKSRGRNTYPIERCIEKYKIDNCLEMRKTRRCCKVGENGAEEKPELPPSNCCFRARCIQFKKPDKKANAVLD